MTIIKKLAEIANSLDKAGHMELADEVESLISAYASPEDQARIDEVKRKYNAALAELQRQQEELDRLDQLNPELSMPRNRVALKPLPTSDDMHADALKAKEQYNKQVNEYNRLKARIPGRPDMTVENVSTALPPAQPIK